MNYIKNLSILIFLISLFSCSQTKSFEAVGNRADIQAKPSGESLKNNDRKIVYKANLTLEVKEVEGQREQIIEIAKQMNGFMVVSENTYIHVRVPAPQLQPTIDAIEKLGKLTRERVSSKDVTDYYFDLDLRLQNAEKARTRYAELLKDATNVTETLSVEKEIDRLTTDIERMRGQMQRLEQELDYSDIYVSVRKRVRPGPLGWVFVGLWEGVKFLFVWD